MRYGLLLVVSLVGCTRLNPAYDGDGSQGSLNTSTSGSGSASYTSGPDDGVDGPSTSSSTSSSTRGSSNGDAADSTSVGSTTVAAEGTTGPVGGSTGECEPVIVMLEPLADTFIARGKGACTGLTCETLDFGAALQGPIEGVPGDFESYLLMSFDLAQMELPQGPLNATLSVHVLQDAAA